jgi:transposase
MAGHQKDPLRPLTCDERLALEQVRRSHTAPAAEVARAKELLAVADGASFEAAARGAGRKSGDAVAHLVARFNREGIDALVERHGGGQPKQYTAAEQERILREVHRAPDRDEDGTATWSLTTLQRALRRAPKHTRGIYDLEVDTSQLTPTECALEIKRVVDERVSPSAFNRLVALQTDSDG